MADVIDQTPETDAAVPTALELRHPGVPTTLAELAVLKGQAAEIIEARIRVLETARQAGIRATHPEDWLLFRSPDDLVVGYLQDSGCERVRDIFGISITPTSSPEKISGAVPGEFHYLVRGDGTCTLTSQQIAGIEGGRSSTEDFCRDKSGAALELAVRKAARANLDGQIVRELAGLGSVPLAQLDAAWSGTHKSSEHCRKGRGFGSRSERLGANPTRGGAPDVEPPVCPHCSKRCEYRPAKDSRKAFYGCPDWAKHRDKKFTVDVDEWLTQLRQKGAASAPREATPPSKVEPDKKPLTADEVFGGAREPGSEG